MKKVLSVVMSLCLMAGILAGMELSASALEPERVNYPTFKSVMVYDGEVKNAVNAPNLNAGYVLVSGDASAVDAGNYSATYELQENYVWTNGSTAPCTIYWMIKKADPVVTAPTAVEGLKYNGEDQVLVNAGSTTGGTIQYSIDGVHYSGLLPVASEEKEHTVYYKVVGDKNYSDVEPQTLTVTIHENIHTLTFIVDENRETVSYDFGEKIANVEKPEKEGYTFTGWSDEIPAYMGDEDLEFTAQFIKNPTIWLVDPADQVGYKAVTIYNAQFADLPEGAIVHWIVDGQDVGKGTRCVVSDKTEDYTIQARIIGADGKDLAETEELKVTVDNSLSGKLTYALEHIADTVRNIAKNGPFKRIASAVVSFINFMITVIKNISKGTGAGIIVIGQ